MLTEPLRFRLGHPMDHSNAAGSPSSLRFRDANRSRSRMSIDGICVQVRGNVLGVSLARNSIWRTSTKGEAHFCISRVRNAVAPNKKAASRRFKFCWGNIAARIRSLNFVGKVTGVPVPVLAQTPLLGHPRAFQRYFAYQVPHSGRPCNHV